MNFKSPFWTVFAAIAGGALVIALVLLWWARSNFADAEAAFRSGATEQRQLESGNPYPSDANVRKMRGHLADYRASLGKLKAELATHVLAVPQLQPNEFQSRLLEAITSTTSNAREHRVKLPDNFKLGFNEFVSTLPKTEEASKLGQELAQIQLLLNMIIEARADGITMFRRVGHETAASGTGAAPVAPTPTLTPLPRTAAAHATTGSGATEKMIESRAVEFSISAPPSAARKIVNAIASATDQFFIMRTLHVKNQKDKGPPREVSVAGAAARPTATPAANSAATPGANPAGTPAGAIQFIVGNEHIDMSARIELVDFNF